MDICMTFNTSARSLIKYGHARKVDGAEGMALLAQAMIAARRFAVSNPVHTSNFIPEINRADCTG